MSDRKSAFHVRYRKDIFYLLIIILFSYIFFFYALGDYSLKEPDEGRYAEIPREMVESGDYIVPRLNYVRYFEKPPLLYWSVAIFYKLFGIDEWSFRLTNAAFALFSVLSLYFFARRWFNKDTALLSSMILMSSMGFFFMARIVTLDMCFSSLLFASLLCFYGFYRDRNSVLLYLFYAFMGLATLAKGPVAVVLLGGTILFFLITEKNLSFLRQLKLAKGVAIYVCIVMPWIAAISLREKEFFHFFFVEEHVLRFATNKHNRSGPLYYFIPALFGGMFPWSVFIPRSITKLWQKKELRLFIVWSGVTFCFFSVSGSKLPPYILPTFPALALIVGSFLYENRRSYAGRTWEIILFMAIFAVFCLPVFLRIHQPFLEWIGRLSEDAPTIAGQLKYFALGISISSMAALSMLSLKTFNRYVFIFMILFGYSLSFVCVLMGFNVNVIDRLNTSKELATAVNKKRGTYDYLVSYDCYQQALPFYTKSRFVLADQAGELRMGSTYEDAKKHFISESEFMQLLKSDKKVLFVAKANAINKVRERAPMVGEKIWCQNGKCLYANYE